MSAPDQPPATPDPDETDDQPDLSPRERWERYERYPYLLARAVVYGGALAVVAGLVWSIRSTLTVLLVAFFFAYLVDPLVGWLQRRGLKRGLAIGALVGGGTLTGGLLVALLVPFVSADLRELGERLPARLHHLAEAAPLWIEQTFGVRPPDDLQAALSDVAQRVRTAAPGLASSLGQHLAGVAKGAASAVGTLVSLALIPLFAFYLLRDFGDTKRRLINELVPPRKRRRFAARLDRIDDALGGFVRGQLTVCACLAVVYTTGLLIGGVPLAFVVGPLAGLATLVPFLGVAVFTVLGLLTAALEAQGTGPLIAVGVTLAVAQALEGLVLTPNIVGSRVGLSAFGVLISIAAFGEMLGFVGVLLAVPLGATLKILWPDLRALWRGTRVFSGKVDEG
jgi:predicted PurR-regulated permease PerM